MIFNRVLMKANPNYFNLPNEDQEDYRLNFFNEADKNGDIYDSIIGKELFGKELKESDFRNFSDKEYYKYNKKKAEFVGYGDNKIIINEFFMIDRSLKTLKNVYNYDFEYEKEQIVLELKQIEETGHGDPNVFKNKKYNFCLRSIWANMIIENDFYYTTFISASSYMYDMLLSYVTTTVDGFIPNKIKEVEINRSSFLGNFGLKKDANGKEKHLKELTSRSYKSLSSLYENLIEECKNLPSGVILEKKYHSKDENHMTFIVTNESVSKKLNWKTIYQDIKENEIKLSTLDSIIENYKIKINQIVEEHFLDIEKNFIPDQVVPIKEMEIIISDQAMSDFERIFKDDEDED